MALVFVLEAFSRVRGNLRNSAPGKEMMTDRMTKTALLAGAAVRRFSAPYVLCMVLAILILCLMPGLVTWLPDLVMGPLR